MSHLIQPLGPVQNSERINSLDILRGVALLGILLMNITGFGLVFQAYGDPSVQGGAEGLNLYSWITTNMFFEGTMRAMFSMLFGVGMILLTRRMERKGGGIEVADIYYRRTIWLFIFGLVHAYLILWPGDILYAYGLFGLFLFPFRNTSARKLIIAALILTLAGIALEYFRSSALQENYMLYQKAEVLGNKELPAEVMEGKKTWTAVLEESKPSAEKVAEASNSMHGNYGELVLYLAPINRMVQTVFNYDYNPWDVLPMMLLGMALFRLKVITAELKNRTYLYFVLLGYGIGLPVNYIETITILNSNFSPQAFMESSLTYPVGRIAMAMGHIGMIMLFCKSGYFSILKRSLTAVGRMALTNYIMHSVICAIIFTGVGFSLFGKLQRFELYFVVAGIWLFQLIISPLWLNYFRFGPLEWLWRSLTYKEIQPFRRIRHVNLYPLPE